MIRTTELAIEPFCEVDAAFAWDEGEGDRTLAWWRDAHREFFTRTRAARGLGFDDDELCVLERFAVVWPSPDEQGDAPPGGRFSAKVQPTSGTAWRGTCL